MSERSSKKIQRKLPVTYEVDYREMYFKGIKLVVYIWAIRSACIAISSGMVGIFELSDRHWSNESVIGIKSLTKIHWDTFISNCNLPSSYEISEPRLYGDVPIISNSLLQAKLFKLIPLSAMKLKIASNSFFNYYNIDRLWSDIYSNLLAYNEILISEYVSNSIDQNVSIISYFNPLKESMNSHKDSENICSTTNTCNKNSIELKDKYIYGTYPNITPYLSGLAPGLAQYLAIESDKTAKVSLWISSNQITSALHYDHDDNFLLQIDGNKRVILLSPEAISILTPYSSYHPYWRQSSTQHDFIKTKNDFIHYLEKLLLNNTMHPNDNDNGKANEVEEMEMINTRTKQRKKSNYNHYTSKTYKNEIIKKQLINNKYGEIKIWFIDLKPGDMLYIPAGYYHLISTLSESISINAWFPSKFSEIYSQLLNIDLPFSIKDMKITLEYKITQFIFIIKQLFHQLDIQLDLLIDLLLARYQISLNDVLIEDELKNKDIKYCSIESWNHLNQSTNPDYQKCLLISMQLYDIFKRQKGIKQLDTSLILLSVIDYMEEVLLLIMNTHKIQMKPITIYSISQNCFNL